MSKFMFLVVLSCLGMNAMQEDQIKSDSMHGGNFLQAMNEERQKDADQAQESGYYNQHHPLLLLPKELSNQIFTCCCLPCKDQSQSLALLDGIKNLMRLSLVCKKYNDLLSFKTIGDLCKNYAQEDKDNIFKELGEFIDDCTYSILRVPFLILLCAGADSKLKLGSGSLLWDAVIENDEQLVQQLFECKADPNEIYNGFVNIPIFFYLEKIEILKVFLAQEDFNIHAIVGYDNVNVLWHVAVAADYSAELIKFYIDQGVDARQCDSNGCCLLHKLTSCCNLNMNEHLKKVAVFLDAIPDMINVVIHGRKTPLDCAESFLEVYNRGMLKKPEGYEKLIELYKQHGALRAIDLK